MPLFKQNDQLLNIDLQYPLRGLFNPFEGTLLPDVCVAARNAKNAKPPLYVRRSSINLCELPTQQNASRIHSYLVFPPRIDFPLFLFTRMIAAYSSATTPATTPQAISPCVLFAASFKPSTPLTTPQINMLRPSQICICETGVRPPVFL
jgi:hypothetical protein